MLRRTGFKRAEYERKPVVHTPIAPANRRQVSTGPAELTAVAKSPPGRNQAYRDLARDKPCMLRVPQVCCNDSATVVLAHSNKGSDGKAMGMKADDARGSAWACFTCHQWVDQGRAPAAEKDAAMAAAHARMLPALAAIAGDPAAKARDRAAAQWALDRIALTLPA